MAPLTLPGVVYDRNTNDGRNVPYNGTRFHFAVYLPAQGKILVGGGNAVADVSGGGFPPVNNAALYDVASDTWSAAASMPFGMNMPHTNAVVLADGRVLV